MARVGNATVINIFIGVVIGFCIAIFFEPLRYADKSAPLRYLRTFELVEKKHDHHDAHSESDVNDADAPKEAFHFHANGTNQRKPPYPGQNGRTFCCYR